MPEPNFTACYRQSRAILVGIDKYIHTSPLSYAVADCDSVAEVLASNLRFPTANLTILRNEEATREGILASYLSLASAPESADDRVIFFFAGHGITREGYTGPVGYLVPVDGDPDRLGTLLRWDDLTRNADLIPAKHIMFILDACFSGLALRRGAQQPSRRFLTEILRRRARQVLTAGKADQVVADGGGATGHNSVFTGHLLEGLRGAAATDDGMLTANSLMHYVYRNVGTDPKSNQTPDYGYVDGDGDVVLITPGIDLSQPLSSDLIVQPAPQDLHQDQAMQPQVISAPGFALVNGYQDPTSPAFGRNEYSSRLATLDFDGDRAEIRPLSWVALVLEPAIPLASPLDLVSLAVRYKNPLPDGGAPQRRLRLPESLMTSLSAVTLFHSIKYNSPNWTWYIRIDRSGALELCDAYHTYFTYKDMHAFRYVQLVGLAWQFIFFARQVLAEAAFTAGARLLVNLVGTRDAILADFAKGEGKERRKWLQPGEHGYLADGAALLNLKCPDPNLQLQYDLVLGSLDDSAAFSIVRSLATSLGLAFNHQSEPRCFLYGTEDFPWDQYFHVR